MAIKSFIERPRIIMMHKGVDVTPAVTPGARNREAMAVLQERRDRKAARNRANRLAGFPKQIVPGVIETSPGQFQVDDSKPSAVIWLTRQ